MSPEETRTDHSSRPPAARLFFALWPPHEQAARLADKASIAAGMLGGRPTRIETIHLTLAFLGETVTARLPELHALANGIKGESFAITIDRFGYWRHNHLFWAGCSKPPEQLFDLYGRLQVALADSKFPIDPPIQAFTPHLTLLRKVPICTTIAGLDFPVTERLTWLCDRFVLVQSESLFGKHRYQMLGEYLLA
ncbi:MAG: RNA 2',3'-cyclic phosphodiesterase [Betaproteobacteria bacterium]|nr:RNA 2',3'-cyclic phosphodiesterase [Betaproteobacteria bacterium]